MSATLHKFDASLVGGRLYVIVELLVQEIYMPRIIVHVHSSRHLLFQTPDALLDPCRSFRDCELISSNKKIEIKTLLQLLRLVDFEFTYLDR